MKSLSFKPIVMVLYIESFGVLGKNVDYKEKRRNLDSTNYKLANNYENFADNIHSTPDQAHLSFSESSITTLANLLSLFYSNLNQNHQQKQHIAYHTNVLPLVQNKPILGQKDKTTNLMHMLYETSPEVEYQNAEIENPPQSTMLVNLDGPQKGNYVNLTQLSNNNSSLNIVNILSDIDNSVQVDEQATSLPNLVDKSNNSWMPIGLRHCGRQHFGNGGREPKIVGGDSSIEGEFPWAVSILRHGSHHCGGVIVHKKWILTAAHCVRNQPTSSLVVRTGVQSLAGGSLSQRTGVVSSQQQMQASTGKTNGHVVPRDYSVDKIVIHDDFSKQSNSTTKDSAFFIANSLQQQIYTNNVGGSNNNYNKGASTNNADIALVRIRNEIHFNELAWPVCFPSRDVGSFSGSEAVVVGWGKVNEKSEEFSADLKKVSLVIIDNKVCQSWFRQAGRDMTIDERIICAGYRTGGKDACHGDSGGPLLVRASSTDQYTVVGVVSTGIGCARPLLPGLYSRVSSYMDWIDRYVGYPQSLASGGFP